MPQFSQMFDAHKQEQILWSQNRSLVSWIILLQFRNHCLTIFDTTFSFVNSSCFVLESMIIFKKENTTTRQTVFKEKGLNAVRCWHSFCAMHIKSGISILPLLINNQMLDNIQCLWEDHIHFNWNKKRLFDTQRLHELKWL